MSSKRLALLLVVLITASMVLSACESKTETVVETVVVKETVVEKETIVETVIVEGTPEIVEVEVTKEVIKEVEVEVTAVSEPTDEKDTLVIALSSGVTNLNPGLAYGAIASTVQNIVFDRLTRRDHDMVTTMAAAESLEMIDPLTWEVKLRPGIKFTNGNPLDAEAVKYSFERYGTEGDLDTWYYGMLGLDHVEVIDELTAHIITLEPNPILPRIVEMGFRLVDPEYYSQTSREELAVNPIGSGPYKVVEFVTDDRVVLERNEDYWGEPPEFERVIVRSIAEPATRLAELEAGNVDIVERLPLDKVGAIDAMSNVHSASVASGRRVMYYIVQEPGTPLADKRVRQALQYAVDRQTIIDTLFGGMTYPMATIVNPPNAHTGLEAYPFDPDKARELLAEAGYADGFEMNLWTTSGLETNDLEVSQATAAYLEDVGIDVNLQVVEATVFEDGYYTCEFDDIYLMSGGTEFHAQGELQDISTEYSWCFECAKWDNPEWDQLYADLRKEIDWDKREEISTKLQEMTYDDVPILMLYYEPFLYGVSDDVVWEPRVDAKIWADLASKAQD